MTDGVALGVFLSMYALSALEMCLGHCQKSLEMEPLPDGIS